MSQKLPVSAQATFWFLAGLIFLGVVILFKAILLPFIIGAIIAYLLNPIVEILGRKGLRRWVASLAILGIFILFVVVLLGVSVPLLARELTDFISNVPHYAHRASVFVEARMNVLEQRVGFDFAEKIQSGIRDNLGKTLSMGQQVVGGVAAGILMGGSALVGFVTMLLLVPIVAYFMMKDWPRIVGFVHHLIPKAHKFTINGLLKEIDTKISGFIRGQLMVCLFLGVMYAVTLSIAGLDYGALIGLGTGLLSIIPYVGSTIGLLASLGVAAFQSSGDITYISVIAAIFFSGQFIEGNFITPKLIGDSVGLHPLWIIFALLAGGSLMGLTGMLIAIPLAAVVSVLIGFAIRKYKQSDFYLTPEKAPAVITDMSEIIEHAPHE